MDAHLAEAFLEEDQTPSTPQVVAPPPAAPAPPTGYVDTMKNIVRFLTAVQNTPAGDTTKTQFSQVWARTHTPGSMTELTSAMQAVYAIPPKHLVAVFENIPDDQRQYFHGQCLRLSETVKDDMPDLSLAAALLRWLIQAGMPALQKFPEDGLFGTTANMTKNYAAVDYACRVARPDESNQEVQKAHARVKQLEERLAADSKKPLQQTPKDSKPSSSSNSKTVTIILVVLLVLTLIALICMSVLYYKNRAPKPAAVPEVNLGGRGAGGGKGILDDLPSPALDTSSPGLWGFSDLV